MLLLVSSAAYVGPLEGPSCCEMLLEMLLPASAVMTASGAETSILDVL